MLEDEVKEYVELYASVCKELLSSDQKFPINSRIVDVIFRAIVEDRRRDERRTGKRTSLEDKLATEKQINCLDQLGVEYDPISLTKKEASRLIHEKLREKPDLATQKQKDFMDQLSIEYPDDITKREASELIDKKIGR